MPGLILKISIQWMLIFLTSVSLLHAKSPSLVFTTIEGSINSKPCIEILTQAYEQLDIQFRVKYYPAERSLVAANKGTLDGEIQRIAGVEKNYSNLIMIPQPIGKLEGCAFVKDIRLEPGTGWAGLKPYRIGILRGSKFSEHPTQNMERVLSYDHKNLFHLLDQGRIDVVVVARLTGMLELKKGNYKGITRIDPPLVELPIFHYIHKRHQNLVQPLSEVLYKMKKQGKIQAIWNNF